MTKKPRPPRRKADTRDHGTAKPSDDKPAAVDSVPPVRPAGSVQCACGAWWPSVGYARICPTCKVRRGG